VQEALPFIVALVVFIGVVLVMARQRPSPKPRNRYARWNAEHRPRKQPRASRAR
jgi:hypothetical protein